MCSKPDCWILVILHYGNTVPLQPVKAPESTPLLHVRLPEGLPLKPRAHEEALHDRPDPRLPAGQLVE